MMNLDEVFSVQAVADLAGPRVYPRGVGYHADGRVEPVAGGDQRLEATVRGVFPYSVALWVDDGGPRWSCTCPYAEDGAFCKHCVAVALTVAPDEVPPFSSVAEPAEPTEPSVDSGLTSYVDGLTHDRLVEVVLEQSDSDWALRERLDAEARAVRGDGPDLASWQRRIDSAFAPYGDYVPYGETDRWASDILSVIDGLAGLASAGHGDAVIVLTEHGHRCNEAAIQYIDDSDGWITNIEWRLAELHLAACESARPDPVALARRLVDLELTSELDGFRGAAATYAGVLGKEGIGEYRRILSPRWADVKGQEDRWSGDRFSVEKAMIGVALGSGDPDALIEVLSERDLHPRDYVEIAGALVDADRQEEAIGWARRGLAEWVSRPNQLSELRALLAALLEDRGQHEQAVELFWDGFEAAPSVSSYRALLTQAGDDSEAWSKQCIDALRTQLAAAMPNDEAPRSPTVSSPSVPLIEILMYEGDVDGAWAVASGYGAYDRVWSTLAKAREKTHPLDSIPVYEREVLAHIDQKKRRSYRAAVDLLAHVQWLADSAREPEVFSVIVERVRTEHRAKWTLMEMLDGRGW